MKTRILATVLFAAGVILGYLIIPTTMRWIASAEGVQFVSLRVDGMFWISLWFALGCGVLFSLAPVVGAWAHPGLGQVRRTLPYLLAGCAVCVVVAWYHRWMFASLPLEVVTPAQPVLISIDAIPTLRLPMSGVIAMVILAMVAKLSNRSRPGSAIRMHEVT